MLKYRGKFDPLSPPSPLLLIVPEGGHVSTADIIQALGCMPGHATVDLPASYNMLHVHKGLPNHRRENKGAANVEAFPLGASC